MFADLQNEINHRILATRLHFDACCGPGFPTHASMSKGLTFVLLYAIYEYATKSAVRGAINEIKAQAHSINALIPEFLALALDSNVQSVMDSGKSQHWNSRIQLFRQTCSANAIDTADTAFPHDGSHFRIAQLRTIWAIFGISEPVVPDGRLIPLVNELVENRNAIAHGRSTPDEVGRNYTKSDILKKIEDTRKVCVHVAITLENSCSDPSKILR